MIDSARRTATLAVLVLLCVTAATAQQTTPFVLIGHIEKFELTPPLDPLSAAKITVHGITVTIPRNTIVTMPATYLTPHDIFKGPHPTAAGLLQTAAGVPVSGLALLDPAPFTPLSAYEASIVGNIVGDEYRAGLIGISQHALATADGWIKAIDYTTGELLVGPEQDNPAVSAHVRLNDPSLGAIGGRYGRADSFDERFTSDQDNPTVHATTGYPMCVPRFDPATTADPECPQVNRPKVGLLFRQRFTIGSVDATGGNFPAAPPCTTCNARKQAPFEIGDRITYSGTLAKVNPADPADKRMYISAHTVEAWLGIYTSPGVDPAYVALDVAIVGTGGIPFPGIDQETGPGKVIPGAIATTRLRIEALTTDPSRATNVFAVDYLPNGDANERLLITLAPTAKPPFGRQRQTVDRSNFLPPPKEFRIRINGLPSGRTPDPAIANGLLFGEYTAPVEEYIFPENTVFGQRPVPANFENLCFLRNGSGPLTTLKRTAATPVVGKLDPWPESGHPDSQVPCP